MNKAEFVQALADDLGTDRRSAAKTLDAFTHLIYARTLKGEKVTLTGFGTFEKRDRAARTARNPATGEPVKLKKTSVPSFRAGSEFKDVTAGRKKMTKDGIVAKKEPAKVAAAPAPVKAKSTKATKAKKAKV